MPAENPGTSSTARFRGVDHRIIAVIAAVFLVVASWTNVAADQLTPRAATIKPAQTIVSPAIHRTDEIYVKFVDDMQIRLRQGVMTDLSNSATASLQRAMDAVPNGVWMRWHEISEVALSRLRTDAEANLGRRLADLNLEYRIELPVGMDAAKAIDALNKLDIVEIALPVPLPIAAPLPPSYQSNQGYLDAATGGVDAICMWQLPGGTGSNSSVADIEYSWNFNHDDLPTFTLLGPTPIDPFDDNNHGTAVLGEMGSRNNGWGATGIAYDSTMYVVGAYTSSGYNVASAITTALLTLGPGDVILIEQQISGPNYTGDPPGTQFGLVPVEWYQPFYNAIGIAVGHGVVVVEAAGNGSQNLDAAIYSTGNGGHWPFLAANDSGAIIVGAGASPGGSDTDRSRLSFSNYGSTVDLQGWGENVCTTGYGYLYSAEGVNRYFIRTFSGTSSASPIVAGACLTLQSAYYGAKAAFLTPAQVKTHLRNTGSPQQAGAYPTSQNIGPRPESSAALCAAVPAMDANSNLVPDLCEQLAGIEACCFVNGGCTDTTPDNCLANGGTPHGAGTTCAESDCWGDATPPTPNPMTWESQPHPISTTSISMTASPATDDEYTVEYGFYSGSGAAQSGWTTNRAYAKNGLSANFPYSYKVKARDTSPHLNETAFSTPDYWSATAIQTPTGITFANVTDTAMDVTAGGTFTNLNYGDSGLYFEMTPAAGSGANVWTSGSTSTTVHVSGLTPGQTYTFRVKARNYYGTRGGAYETPYTTTYEQATNGGGPICTTTFGDVNADTVVNGADIAGFVRAKLGLPPESGENQACADNGGSVDEDIAAFIDILLN